MSDRFAAHLPPAIRNLPARTRRLTIGAAVAIPALLAAPARPGNAGSTGHTSTVYSVDFSPDGKMLASGSRDGTMRLWDLATHRQIGNPLTGHAGAVYSVAFSPDWSRSGPRGRPAPRRFVSRWLDSPRPPSLASCTR